MQNSLSLIIQGQEQPIHDVNRISGRGKLVRHSGHGIVFLRALNDLIDEARLIGPKNPGKADYKIIRGNLQNLILASEL